MANSKQFKFFESVALQQLRVSTLVPQNRDSLDFHDVSVRSIVSAFQAIWDKQQAKINALQKELEVAREAVRDAIQCVQQE